MVFRNIQRVEVVPFVFDFGTKDRGKAHAAEDIGDLIDRACENVPPPQPLRNAWLGLDLPMALAACSSARRDVAACPGESVPISASTLSRHGLAASPVVCLVSPVSRSTSLASAARSDDPT